MILTDQGVNPRTGELVGPAVAHTAPADVDAAARAAARAAPVLAGLTLTARAGLLRAVADALEAARGELVPLADAESGLGVARLDGELTRTRVQLELFAAAVAEGSLLDVYIDHADPDRARPDLRRLLVPLGPVAVFAASNFPFAFSVAGGDTASALAAGCPVVVKAHPGHPGLSARCGELIAAALARAGAPAGTFALVHGFEAGRALVTHPAITAVGFTGSVTGGRALFDLAAARADPIPFYGELGSLNPVVVTPGAVAARGEAVAEGFTASYTLGSGQFCTKPGLLFLPAGHGLAPTLTRLAEQAHLGPLLGERILQGFRTVAGDLADVPGVRRLATGTSIVGGFHAPPTLLAVGAPEFVAHAPTLLTECFGPAALIVEYGSTDELLAALDVIEGSLTGTVHGQPDSEPELVRVVLDRLSRKAGRVIWDGWPTGVAVTWAQQHGGPWPATTASGHTSVGVTAVRRFQRPVAYQGLPDALLPPPLREENPWGVPRRVDAEATIHSGQA